MPQRWLPFTEPAREVIGCDTPWPVTATLLMGHRTPFKVCDFHERQLTGVGYGWQYYEAPR
jgi:hypothetical protein